MNIRFNNYSSLLRLGSNSVTFSGKLNTFTPSIGYTRQQPTEWRALSELQDIVTAASDNDVINLGFKGYRPASEADANSFIDLRNKNNITIKNGMISGSLILAWSSTAGGVYSATLPSYLHSLEKQVRLLLSDELSTDRPSMSRWNYGPPQSLDYAFSYVKAAWPDLYEGSRGIIRNNGVPIETSTSGQFFNEVLITDQTLRNDISSHISSNPRAFGFVCRGEANSIGHAKIESWDETTGLLALRSTASVTSQNGYFDFQFVGGITSPSPGQYSIDFDQNLVYYNPINGDPTQAGLPILPKCLWVNRDFSLDSVRLSDTAAEVNQGDLAAALLYCNAGDSFVVNVHNCEIKSTSGVGIYSAKVNLTDSVLSNNVHTNFYVYDGSQISGCYFGSSESADNRVIMISGAARDNTPVNRSEITRNWFNQVAGTHAQGLSLYQTSWVNADVSHNVFYNCMRAIAWQGDSTLRPPGSMSISNNLIWMDTALGDPSGQRTLAMNGNEGNLTDASSQSVTISHNTIWNTGTWLDYEKQAAIDVRYNVSTPTKVVGNMLGTVMACDTGGIGTEMSSNGFLLDPASYYGQSGTSLDIYNATISSTSFEPSGDAASAAPDSDVLGIRWSVNPTRDMIQDDISQWFFASNPLSLPEYVVTEGGYFNVVNTPTP